MTAGAAPPAMMTIAVITTTMVTMTTTVVSVLPDWRAYSRVTVAAMRLPLDPSAAGILAADIVAGAVLAALGISATARAACHAAASSVPTICNCS